MKVARHVSEVGGVVGIAMGILVLIGWTFHIRLLVTVCPGLPSMSLNTALGLILAGTSVILLRSICSTSNISGWRKGAHRISAIAVVAIGLLTILEYGLNVDLYIDRLLFPLALFTLESGWATRPSPQTATCFLLLGLTLLFLGLPSVSKGVSQLMAVMSFAVSLVALLGYAYGLSAFYSISPTIGMALHTALAVALLSIAVLCIFPDAGVMRILFRRTSAGSLARRLLPAIFVLPPALGWLRLRGEHLGLFGPEAGVAVMVVGTILALAALTWLAAESFSRAEDQFRAVAESANDAVISADSRGQIAYFNPTAERMFGYLAREVRKQPLTLLMPERFHASHQTGFERYLSTGIPHVIGKTVEMAGKRKDGREFPLELSLATWRAGDSTNFTGIIRDISERKHAEEELLVRTRQLEAARNEAKLKHSEERFSKAFRSSLIALTISTKVEGRYVDANEAFLKLMGYGWEELVGYTTSALNVWAIPEDREAMIQQLEQTGTVQVFETEFKAKSGKIKKVQVSAELIMLDGVACILAMTLDITESRRLEDQLRQAQKLEAVGRLAGGIAHDFNNLLGVIVGYSDLARQELTKDTVPLRHVEQIKAAGQRAAELTRQLLAFSRQQVLQLQNLDLNRVVNDLSKMLVRMIGEDVFLTFTPAVALGTVRADLRQVEQILMNLTINARDAMPAGGEIHMETANVDLDRTYAMQHANVQPGAYVMLSVSDTGCGMDPKIMSQIFEPFFTTKPPGEGTGLGLSTVHGIVNQSGGHIWVYSEPGRGTTFKLYFPRIEGPAVPLHEPTMQTTLATGTETILVVEDDPPLRELVVSLLGNAGYKVLQAESAQAAISLSKQYDKPVHLLLTDIVMPGAGGSELASGLRLSRPGLKVLYMSGYASTLIAAHGVLAPNTPLLQKPFTQHLLLSQVRALLDGTERSAG